MSIKIRLRDNGPIVIEGPCVIYDAEGNVFPLNPDKPVVALCRCTQSSRRPFCDGTHKTCGFVGAERAPAAAPPVLGVLPVAPPNAPPVG